MPTSFAHNSTMYYYVKNLQGDIVQIVDYLGNVVVTYTYDVLGKILNQTDSTTCNLANLNPFRYRGYVYDNETGLYYLQSRYYDPIIGRFLNADDTEYLGATGTVLSGNLFAYCENNPIISSDECGFSSDKTLNLVWLLIKNTAKTKIWKHISIYGKIKFYNAVKNHGIWDYKRTNRQPSWARNGKFKAFGRTITTEQLGNLNFGFTGASMGFSPAIFLLVEDMLL